VTLAIYAGLTDGAREVVVGGKGRGVLVSPASSS